MNEFSGKKLGEVLAFAQVGSETLEKGKAGFLKTMSESDIQVTEEMNARLIDALLSLAEESGVKDIVEKKSVATGEKLRTMRDLYVKDEWDNAAELSEWSGFFEGAAIVHWALVEGIGEGLQHAKVLNLAQQAKTYHEEKLKKFEQYLKQIGISKVTA